MTDVPDIRGEGWPSANSGSASVPPVAVVLALAAFGLPDAYRVVPLEDWQREPGCTGCPQCRWRKVKIEE